MTINEAVKNFCIESDSLVILTRSKMFHKFMCNHNPHVNNEIFDEHINFAEMLAEEAREGGIYYQLIKDLHVEKVIPFEGDWNDKNYVLVIDASEDQIDRICCQINALDHTCKGAGFSATMQ